MVLGVLLLYESNITSAYNLISKKGLSVTINRKTNSSYDVATGTMTVSTASETGYAVVIKNSRPRDDRTINEASLTDDNYITILLSAKGITRPQLGDSVVVSTVSYVIARIKELAPNYDEPILYTLELRR